MAVEVIERGLGAEGAFPQLLRSLALRYGHHRDHAGVASVVRAGPTRGEPWAQVRAVTNRTKAAMMTATRT